MLSLREAHNESTFAEYSGNLEYMILYAWLALHNATLTWDLYNLCVIFTNLQFEDLKMFSVDYTWVLINSNNILSEK